MPDFWTHIIHGVETLRRGQIRVNEPRLFLLGTQGPDPFFYAYKEPHVYQWGFAIHSKKCGEFMHALLKDEEIPFSYKAGFVCHQILDGIAHRFIGYLENDARHKKREMTIDKAIVRKFLNRSLSQVKSWKVFENMHLSPLSRRMMLIIAKVYETRDIEECYFEHSVQMMCNVLKKLYNNFHFKHFLAYIVNILTLGIKNYLPLFPYILPHDILNEKKREWIDTITGKKRNESFLEILERTIVEAIHALKTLREGKIPDIVDMNFQNGHKTTRVKVETCSEGV
mgnify:CR=1 FL=1